MNTLTDAFLVRLCQRAMKYEKWSWHFRSVERRLRLRDEKAARSSESLDRSPRQPDLRTADAELRRRGSGFRRAPFPDAPAGSAQTVACLSSPRGEGRPAIGRSSLSFLSARPTPSSSRDSELRASEDLAAFEGSATEPSAPSPPRLGEANPLEVGGGRGRCVHREGSFGESHYYFRETPRRTC